MKNDEAGSSRGPFDSRFSWAKRGEATVRGRDAERGNDERMARGEEEEGKTADMREERNAKRGGGGGVKEGGREGGRGMFGRGQRGREGQVRENECSR